MPERVLVLPSSGHAKHRRHSGLHRALDTAAKRVFDTAAKRVFDTAAKAGSAVTLGGLLVLAGAAVATAGPASTPEHVVTFEIAGHR